MDLFIVTGGSKGLGQHICQKALNQGHSVLNISRTRPEMKDSRLTHLGLDLSRGDQVIRKFAKALEKIDLGGFKHIHLINNAALLNPVGPLTDLDPADINALLSANIIAPVLLAQITAKKAAQQKKTLTVFNIGSGASFRPIAGWSMYCTSKAALKMFTECTELDLQSSKRKRLRMFHFTPGVLDTNMQKQIRHLKKKDFPGVQTFKMLKKEKKLRSPEDVAAVIVNFCLDPKRYRNSSALISIEELPAKD